MSATSIPSSEQQTVPSTEQQAVPAPVEGLNNVNYRYFLHLISSLPDAKKLKILDYGCGYGTVVSILRNEGYDCYGTDIFYGGASYGDLNNNELFQKEIIRQIPSSGVVPFPDHFFDVIISNQIFEHVESKPPVIKELKRILKPTGFMRHHFPSLEVIREGHIGIPCAHWLPKGKFRTAYTSCLRKLGLGYHKDKWPKEQWTASALDWIDKYCFYEKYSTLRKLFTEDFTMTHQEIDYCRYRAQNRPLLASLLRIGLLRPVYEALFRRLAFMAIDLRPKQG